jgi:hypothetical protein
VVAKTVAAYLLEKGIANAGEYIAKNSWLYTAIPYIYSYLDAPKPLEELQASASASRLSMMCIISLNNRRPRRPAIREK